MMERCLLISLSGRPRRSRATRLAATATVVVCMVLVAAVYLSDGDDSHTNVERMQGANEDNSGYQQTALNLQDTDSDINLSGIIHTVGNDSTNETTTQNSTDAPTSTYNSTSLPTTPLNSTPSPTPTENNTTAQSSSPPDDNSTSSITTTDHTTQVTTVSESSTTQFGNITEITTTTDNTTEVSTPGDNSTAPTTPSDVTTQVNTTTTSPDTSTQITTQYGYSTEVTPTLFENTTEITTPPDNITEVSTPRENSTEVTTLSEQSTVVASTAGNVTEVTSTTEDVTEVTSTTTGNVTEVTNPPDIQTTVVTTPPDIVTTTIDASTVVKTTQVSTTTDPDIIGELPDDTTLELDEIEQVYQFAVIVNELYTEDLGDTDSDTYQQASDEFIQMMTPYYNETSGFKEIRDVIFSPPAQGTAKKIVIYADGNQTNVNYDVIYDYTAMDNKELTCDELANSTLGSIGDDSSVTYNDDCTEPDYDVKVCDYALSECEAGYHEVEINYECVCQSNCKTDDFCQNGGKCEHDEADSVKCWCVSDTNSVYVGDRCQNKISKVILIFAISLGGGVLIIIIAVLIVCLVKSRRKKDSEKESVDYTNRDTTPYGEYSRSSNLQSYDNLGYNQSLDHTTESGNPDDPLDNFAMATFKHQNSDKPDAAGGTSTFTGQKTEQKDPVKEDAAAYVYPHPWTSPNNAPQEPVTQPKDVNRWSTYSGNSVGANRVSFSVDKVDPYKEVKIRRAKFDRDSLANNVWVDEEEDI